jgi:hypothetical protein
VSASCFIRGGLFKSPARVVFGFLLRSRETQARRARDKSQEIEDFKRIIQQQQRTIAELEQKRTEMKFEVSQLRVEFQQLRDQPPLLPNDPPLPHHQFGPKMISVCVNLARVVGLRPTVTCLQLVLDWLGVSVQLPEWTSVRTWLMRAGVAALEEPVELATDWIWMADHSNQIGPEKALVILGLRASQMPPPGVAITHKHVRVLTVEPGVNWKREDVARSYLKLADRAGIPQAIVVDGAVELREGAEVLQKKREDLLILSDLKHYAANVMKKIVGASEPFVRFTALVGSTRSAIQQTELSHLTPPGPKPKARFMNLAGMLTWAQMVLWQLTHPNSKARQEITADRLNEKLGWVKTFAEEIPRWNACQSVVSKSITFINEQGLTSGTAERLAEELNPLQACDDSRAVAGQLLDFVRRFESKLTLDQKPDKVLRLPLSTEILESSFGLYKQLERQHSKGGFTSLLAAFGALLKPVTPESIRCDFARVSVKQTRAWVAKNLKTTLASKRNSAYAECRNATTHSQT